MPNYKVYVLHDAATIPVNENATLDDLRNLFYELKLIDSPRDATNLTFEHADTDGGGSATLVWTNARFESVKLLLVPLED